MDVRRLSGAKFLLIFGVILVLWYKLKFKGKEKDIQSDESDSGKPPKLEEILTDNIMRQILDTPKG
jgi:hypothetical protein